MYTRSVVAVAVVAALAIGLGAPPVAAHELKTPGGTVVLHGHYEKHGHATAENDAPAASHETAFCRFHWQLEPPFRRAAGAATEDQMKREKEDVEELFRALYPPPPGWTPPPGGPTEYWRTIVTQHKDPDGATFATNCHGRVFGGGGCGINSGAEVDKFVSEGFTPLGPREPAEVGMLIVYRAHNKDTGPITHTAFVASIDGNGNPTKATGVFGSTGAWTHPINDVPPSYTHNGGGWKVYKKK